VRNNFFDSSSDALASLIPLAKRVGAQGDIQAFHRVVNLAFHACESRVYDEIHKSMWESLPIQFSLLASDCDRTTMASRNGLRLLDVGCGTGLSSELLLGTKLGQRIQHISLLDTAPEMLALAEQRLKRLGWAAQTFTGEISSVPLTLQYDIILACSVLHHIPDIPGFLHEVALRQRPGGVFLHLQDPNADHQASKGAYARMRELRNRNTTSVIRGLLETMHLQRLAARIHRFANRAPDYISQTNSILIHEGAITRPMTPQEIWSVTDIHVVDGGGVSLNTLRQYLYSKGYDLIKARSYAFFGKLQSDLTFDLAAREARLIESEAEDGSRLSAVWVNRSGSKDSTRQAVR
jgi:2-polyprenyl-3-methyl-5-hydroxy-6-metoxy-1,4-benzoquinol methylase